MPLAAKPKNTKYTYNIPEQVARASATPTTFGVKQLSDLAYYMDNSSGSGAIDRPEEALKNMYLDAKLDPEGWNKESWTGSPTISINNDNSNLANAISSAASQLGNVYQGYVNAQAAASNAANAASREAQQTQFNMNKQLMDLQNEETRKLMQWQMDYNTSSAKAQRDWEEMMSNTAYQRAMADMKAAGLNPILAYTQGGATTPSAATASPVSGQAAGSSVGTYSGQSYHINDTMAMLGATLGVLGNVINSARFQDASSKATNAVKEIGDSIVAGMKTFWYGLQNN